MNNLTIRFATGHDDLERLAQLDSSVVPAAPLIVAEADGRVIAALSTRDGHSIADPFTRTAEAVTLLHRRAAQLTAAPRARRALRVVSRLRRESRARTASTADAASARLAH